MKTAAVVSSVLALVALSIYLGSAHAQPNEARRGTWVAVVNIRDVLKKYSRAQALQAELDEDLKPHKARAKALKDEIDLLATADSSKPEYRKTNAIAIQIKTREWEKVNTAILQVVEEKHTSKMPAVWNDINLAIEAVSKTHGMQVVLGHGDPEAPEVA
ncbi:MAG: OmpH family outer membrane protein, partial [Planctomycetes bacterium]|nr:OmpH family outer membrane protein [Planctomycetota bacterium]